ncbi:MAG: LacI family DNA-binding transcriptional regulator [Rhizobiaceae bacterium]|nr:LacI family DNA-binding transcriptional regulator [Rhizobiaceae bacterium]
MATTLADVAREAGVDISTVSRVLRDDKTQRVAARTRQRILDVVKKLNYQPNAVARALRLARSRTIGIVVPQLDNPVFAEIIAGAEHAAAELGYSLLISHRTRSSDDSDLFRRLVNTNRVDGLLVVSFDEDMQLIQDFQGVEVPIVVINRKIESMSCCVYHNSYKAAQLATNHLIDLGHRQIVHLAGRGGGFNARLRWNGYRDALTLRGVPYDEALVRTVGYAAEDAATATRVLIENSNVLPTAIFAATFLTAAGAMRSLHEMGIPMPDEISVVGIHDAEFALILYPTLTTVRMPNREMGRRAALALCDILSGKNVDSEIVLEPEQLMLRNSTGPCRQG